MIKNALVLLTSAFLSLWAGAALATAASPQPGMWWSPAESGRGYAIDAQGDLMVVTTFAYDNGGRMQWYIASGPLQSGGSHWSGQLLKFDFGQPLNSTFQAPTAMGNDGLLTMDFTSKTTGVVTLPGGRQVSIQRQNFGVGGPPQSLLGQWVFVYSIGSTTWADRFNYTVVAGATSNGTGVVVDYANNAACEYQVSGAFAGYVVGFQYTSSGQVTNQYMWTQLLEEGRGSWISPTTFNKYGMNVYKTQTASGTNKALVSSPVIVDDLNAKGGGAAPQGISIDELTAQDPEVGIAARRLWEALAQH